jgi:hypothetical protein
MNHTDHARNLFVKDNCSENLLEGQKESLARFSASWGPGVRCCLGLILGIVPSYPFAAVMVMVLISRVDGIVVFDTWGRG